MISRFTILGEVIPQLAEARRTGTPDSANRPESVRRIRPYVANFVEAFGYSNAFLFDTDGTLLFQLEPNLDVGTNILSGPLKDYELAEVFDRVRTLLQTETSDYQIYPGRSEPAAFIASPVFSTQGRIVGFVVLELNNAHVFHVFRDYSGLGETGEAMVAMRRGQDGFVYVAPPRKSEGNVASRVGRKIWRRQGYCHAEGRRRPARLRRIHRLPGPAGRRCLVIPPLVPLGNGCQAG